MVVIAGAGARVDMARAGDVVDAVDAVDLRRS